MKALKTHKCFEGQVTYFETESQATGTVMKFSTFTPAMRPRGALIWLSGLTCTDENFMIKAGAHKYLSEAGLMVICPDTSPRGLSLPQEHDAYDFGSGAGFYLNATTPGYKDHYRMYDHITQEIYSHLADDLGFHDKISIMGHSMGGHGALVIGLREAKKFRSVSAFAPIANPVRAPWGQKAFAGYLGEDQKTWAQYDACEILKSGVTHSQPLLVDQGGDDEFLEKQLMPENLESACAKAGQRINLRVRPGYDHSYYFISTFIRDHIEFHAEALD